MLGDFGEMWKEWENSHPGVTDEWEKEQCYRVYGKMYELMKQREEYELKNKVIEEIYKSIDNYDTACDIRKKYGGICTVAETLDFLIGLVSFGAKNTPLCIRDLRSALGTAKKHAQNTREIYAKVLDAMYQDGEDRLSFAKYNLADLDKSIEKYRNFLESDDE